MHPRRSTPDVHNQLRLATIEALAAAVCCRIRFMARHLHAALAALLLIVAACDTTTTPTAPRTGAVAEVELAQPTDPATPLDCRSAHYCYRSCQGAGFLAGESAADLHGDCAAQCEPVGFDATNHWTWWIDAVDTQCEDDWSDECILAAMVPDLHGDDGDLSGTLLDACMQQGASW
ncbi:MAG TPA: hypothetical protein VG755_15805 [Nannocystaceae bacterium]|nr:hypothetical protein [Nannocystaceae bacterium]